MSLDTSIELTPDFLATIDSMENTDAHLFITGKAGTGKSTLLNYFRENTKKNVVVVAPTGIAALNVGGQTIHSFFKFPIGFITSESIKKMRQKELYESIDIIVIDEISMVRADLLDGIDHFMRSNGRDKKKPFGGARMIFIGDMYQLPPVVATNEEHQMFGGMNYNSPYFFSAAVMNRIRFITIQLEKIYRQSDSDFIDVLNSIRDGNATKEHFQKLNERYQPNFTPNDDDFFITLTGTNELATTINQQRLASLREESKTFQGEIDGNFDRKNLPADEVLMLKKGAQVMFIKNDMKKRWVNGTIGKVKDIGKHEIKVEIIDDGLRKVVSAERADWEILKYDFDESSKKIFSEPVGAFIQFPLRLAWAVTIHKSQGKTFDRVMINLGRGAFAHGQLYVALSRCRSLDGIVLKSPIRERDMIVDERIIDFMRQAKRS